MIRKGEWRGDWVCCWRGAVSREENQQWIQKKKKKRSCRKTPWHWGIEDKMADGIWTKQMKTNGLGKKKYQRTKQIKSTEQVWTVWTSCTQELILRQLQRQQRSQVKISLMNRSVGKLCSVCNNHDCYLLLSPEKKHLSIVFTDLIHFILNPFLPRWVNNEGVLQVLLSDSIFTEHLKWKKKIWAISELFLLSFWEVILKTQYNKGQHSHIHTLPGKIMLEPRLPNTWNFMKHSPTSSHPLVLLQRTSRLFKQHCT